MTYSELKKAIGNGCGKISHIVKVCDRKYGLVEIDIVYKSGRIVCYDSERDLPKTAQEFLARSYTVADGTPARIVLYCVTG